MKKKCLMAAVAAAITLTTGVVMANPVVIDGSASMRYRADSSTGVQDQNGTITRVVLNAKTEIDPNFSLYARLGVEGLSNRAVGRDFATAGTFAGEIDQFGFIYNNAGFNYKVGRQDLFLGTGIFYDNTGDIGKNKFLDGVTVTGKTGVTTLQAFALQQNNEGPEDGKLYGVHAAFNPTKNLTLGAAVAQYKIDTDKENVWVLNTKYVDGKATYAADYAKTDLDTDNKAYSIGASYAADSKNTVWVTAYKVEDHASLATTYDPGYKGIYYGADHSFTKDTALHLNYQDRTSVHGSKDQTSFRATVSYNF